MDTSPFVDIGRDRRTSRIFHALRRGESGVASYRKTGSGKWRAEIVRQGTRKSKVFDRKSDAQAWARREEYLIDNGGLKVTGRVGDILDKYAREVSVTKRGARWEILRLFQSQSAHSTGNSLVIRAPGFRGVEN